MNRRVKNISIIIIGILALFLIDYILNVNGNIIPIKASTSIEHPDKIGFQVIRFDGYCIELPVDWKDKGYSMEGGGWSGKLKKSGTVFRYGYGSCSFRDVETLHERLYNARNNDQIMADRIIYNQTDSGYSVRYEWPIDPMTSDTIKTGLITDSLREAYPEYWSKKYYFGKPNYYSYTKYRDSLYFVPIEVPEIIINSHVEKIILDDYKISLVTPKQTGNGITLVNVNCGNAHFSIWSHDLTEEEQKVLTDAGLSTIFMNNIPTISQGEN